MNEAATEPVRSQPQHNLFKEDIDFKKLHIELSETYARIMELRRSGTKCGLRGTGRGGLKGNWQHYLTTCKALNMDPEPCIELEYLSCRMTILCVIMGLAKGRFHVDKLTKSHDRYYNSRNAHVKIEHMTLEDQLGMIHDDWREFILPPEQAE